MQLLASIAIDASVYSIVAIGILVLFVWGKAADLTPDASFLLGALGGWVAVQIGLAGVFLLLFGFVFGASAGATTFVIARLSVPYIMSSLIVVGLAYTAAWLAMGGPLQSISSEASLLHSYGAWFDISLAVSTVAVAAASVVLLGQSRIGLFLRASAEAPASTPNAARWSWLGPAISLTVGNGLVGLAGALFLSNSFFVEVNMGVGILISGLGALMLGWTFLRFGHGVITMVGAAIVGGVILRAILASSLLFDVPGQWFRGLSSVAILVCLVFALGGSRNVFKGLRL